MSSEIFHITNSSSHSALLADLHIKSLPLSFISSLGLQFTSYFYAQHLSNNSSILSILYLHGYPSAFLLSSCKFKPLSLVILSFLARHPVNIFSFIYSLFNYFFCLVSKLRFSLASHSSKYNIPSYSRVLLSFCVTPSYQSLGFGTKLFQAHLNYLRSISEKSLYIRTSILQPKAVSFYSKYSKPFQINQNVYFSISL